MESNKKTDKKEQSDVETISSTILAVIDKLTGKEGIVKLSFEELTLETDLVKVKVNGAVVLEIITRNDKGALKALKADK